MFFIIFLTFLVSLGKYMIEEGIFTDLGSTFGSMLLGLSDMVNNVNFERGSKVMAAARNIVEGTKIGVYFGVNFEKIFRSNLRAILV